MVGITGEGESGGWARCPSPGRAGKAGCRPWRRGSPPPARESAPYLEAHGIRVGELEPPQVVFEGAAREACRGFPANVNILAAISLGVRAGPHSGAEWCGPYRLPQHAQLGGVGSFGRFHLQIENVPTENPRTGILAAQSVIARWRNTVSPIRIGMPGGQPCCHRDGAW